LSADSTRRANDIEIEWRFMANPKKCTNPACSCTTNDGSKYCSPHCEAVAEKTEVVCTCGHAGCRGDAVNV
jgi:hypothetical protein